VACAGRLDAGGRVFDHEALCGCDVQLRGGQEENLRVRLTLPQIAPADIGTEDIEQPLAGVEADAPLLEMASSMIG
jgi:hypothetical protein